MVVTKSDLLHTPVNLHDEFLLISSKTGENMEELYRLIDVNLYPESRTST